MASKKQLEKSEYESNKLNLKMYKEKIKPVNRDLGLFAASLFLMIGVLYGWGVVSLEQGNWLPIIIISAVGFLLYRGFDNTRQYENTINAEINFCQRKIDLYEKEQKER